MKSITFLAILALVGSCSLPSLAAPKSKAKTQKALEMEVATLREQLKRQDEVMTGVSGNAVRAPFGRFLLIKNGAQCLALRVTEHANFRVINNAQHHTTKYEWFLQTDGSMDFSKANVRKGSGEATEYKDKTYAAVTIRAGSFPPLEWSVGDWIYFSEGATPVGGHPPKSKEALREKNLRMASTEWVRIKDVKPKSSGLAWLSKEVKVN